MDALSDVLQTVTLTGGVFLDAHFTAPWCISSGIGSEDCRPFLSNPMQVIAYHYVTQGRMLVQVAGDEPVEVCAARPCCYRKMTHISSVVRSMCIRSIPTT